MPTLAQYVTKAALVPAGVYPFKITAVESFHPEDATKASSVVIKGAFIDGKSQSIFRRVHENMYWLIADDLTKLGIAPDVEIDLSDTDAVAELMQQFVGVTANVQVKIRNYVDKTGEKREDNDFRIKGLTDGSSLV